MFMKKTYLFFAILVSAILLTAGCNKPEQGDEPGPQPGDAPVIELIELSGNNMTVPAEGGQAVIKYKIVNPVEGGMMSAASKEDWVGEFDCNTDGQVSFTVALNETLEDRNSILTLIPTLMVRTRRTSMFRSISYREPDTNIRLRPLLS